jgi:hypothetical protein
MMRNAGRAVLCLAILLATAAVALGVERPLREVRSGNGRYTLTIDPGQPGRSGRDCRGELSESSARGRTARRVWDRALVNDAAPGQAFIRDDGRFVVTLDEYRRGGARNALVVYGERGELLRHFLLTDLLEKGDWKHVKAEGREVVWLKDARCAFGPQADRFVIELPWGRKIPIDLKTLRVIREGTSDTGGLTVVPADVLAQLFGTEAGGGRDAAEGAGSVSGLTPDEQVQANAIAGQLAADVPTTQAVEPAAVQDGAGMTAPSAGANAAPAVQLPASDQAVVEAPAGETTAGDRAGDEELDSSAGRIVVPKPNPADKVNYLTWLNDLGRIDGPDANPVYQAAIAESVPCELDTKLLTAAMRGDPAALASPELTAWVAANAGALAKFREASQYGAKGWSYHSNDGSLIGIVLPDLASLRSLARANVIEGRQLAAAGRPADAAAHYLDTLAAGAHIGSGMTLIEGLVGVAIQGPAADAYLDLQADPAARDLDYVNLAAQAEAACRPARPLAETIAGERALCMDTVQRIWDVEPSSGATVLNEEQAAKLFQMVGSSRDSDVAALVAQTASAGYEPTVAEASLYFDALSATTALPYPQAVAQLKQLETMITSNESTSPLLRTFTPSVVRAHFIETRAETTRRAALLVTNLNAYRQQHGDYPASLDAFADRPFVVDPFSNARFVYRRVGKDFQLYSVGGNGQDDAGVHDQKGETNDVVFWPRPKP